MILLFNEQSIVIFWVNGCKNEWFWQRITCSSQRAYPLGFRTVVVSTSIPSLMTCKRKPNSFKINHKLLKVSRSRNKIIEPQILPKNERTNLFFYPENSQDRKTNSFVRFLWESASLQFCFEIYWPLVCSHFYVCANLCANNCENCFINAGAAVL